MDTVEDTGMMRKEPDRSYSLGVMTGGTIGMWLLGAGTAVLAIIILAGVSGVLGRVLTAVAVLAASAALLLSSGVIISRLAYFSERVGSRPDETNFVRSLSAELLAGCAGVVLGILSLIGLYPILLTTCAIIIFGGAIALGGLSRTISNSVVMYPTSNVPVQEGANFMFTRQLAIIDAGGSLLLGLSLIALGIVALFDVAPLLLNAVSLLGLGGAFFLGASSVGGAMVSALEKRDVYFTHRRSSLRHAA